MYGPALYIHAFQLMILKSTQQICILHKHQYWHIDMSI